MKNKHWLYICGSAFLFLFTYLGKPMFEPRLNTHQEIGSFWEVKLAKGKLSIFNLTLEQSTFHEALEMLGNRFELAIFRKDRHLKLEGYFREVRVGKFTGRVIITLSAQTYELEDYLAQLNLNTITESDRIKVSLEDYPLFSTHKIYSLAFIPTGITLYEEDIRYRFGNPEHIIREPAKHPSDTITHFLYPQKGIDIAIDKRKRALIQYINPKNFDQLILYPLQKNLNLHD